MREKSTPKADISGIDYDALVLMVDLENIFSAHTVLIGIGVPQDKKIYSIFPRNAAI